MRLNKKKILLITGFFWQTALGFENTKVLPKKIRSFQMRSVTSLIEAKTNSFGHSFSLAHPLEKKLSFADVLAAQTSGQKKKELQALMQEEGFKKEDSLGQFQAKMLGQVRVIAPILSYGLSENTTLALAIPLYQARMNSEIAFKIHQKGHQFINTLASSRYNLTESAREAAYKLNNAVDFFQKKLNSQNFQSFADWQDISLGDINLLAKTRFLKKRHLSVASINGLSLPSGRTSNPDILGDIPFGTGHLSFYSAVIVDEPLIAGLILNQYIKYKHSLAAEHAVRLKTPENPLAAKTRMLKRQRGDELEGGVSLQYEPSFGMTAGLGFSFEKKNKDRYHLKDQPEVLLALESSTDNQRQFLEGKLGYSGIEAYKKGIIPIPFSVEWSYKKHLKSKNQFTNDLFQADFSVYF